MDSLSRNRGRPTGVTVRSQIITDHEGNDVNLAWCPTLDQKYAADEPPPFPFQVYFTSGAEKSSRDPSVAESLVRLIERQGNWSRRRAGLHTRFELYTKPLSNTLACIAHQRKEIVHRNRNGIYPRILSKWADDEESYEGRLLVIDRDDCLFSRVVLTGYDPGLYLQDHQDRRWYRAEDVPVVESFRLQTTDLPAERNLASSLEEWWHLAGSTGTEDDLVRRNEGPASPVIYPTLDSPLTEDDMREALNIRPGRDIDEEHGDDPEDQWPNILERFDPVELIITDADAPHLCTEVYTDMLDQPTTSVWDCRLSKTRPEFSFTLYIEYHVLTSDLHPVALFTLLNKGLLASSQWTLDVVNNMPNLEAAFDYHASNTRQRSSARLARLRERTRLVLHKVNNDKLPEELLAHIEDNLVPPEIPNYSSRPMRAHQDLFLYLDVNHVSTGPLIIYSNQAPFWVGLDLQGPKYDYRGVETSEDRPLRVLFLRFWHRVADELHTVWSLCSPRLTLPEADTPRIHLSIDFPEFCFLHSTGNYHTAGERTLKAGYKLYLDFREPITVHSNALFSHDLWNEALDLVDVETGQIRPALSCSHVDRSRADSWSQRRELGFSRRHCPEACKYMKTLEPGRWHQMEDLHDSDGMSFSMKKWLLARMNAGVLDSGRRYALRLRDGVSIPRWTYGRVEERRGPYNLPPLWVETMAGEEVQFDFEWHGDSS